MYENFMATVLYSLWFKIVILNYCILQIGALAASVPVCIIQ